MKTIKIIDLLNKIANGEEVPKRIKVGIYEFYICEKNTIEGDYDYQNEYGEYLLEYLTEWNYVSKMLNEEVEILDEEDEFEDIKPLVLKTFERTGQAVTIDRFEEYSFDNFRSIEDTIAKVILNQKKIISKLGGKNE